MSLIARRGAGKEHAAALIREPTEPTVGTVIVNGNPLNSAV